MPRRDGIGPPDGGGQVDPVVAAEVGLKLREVIEDQEPEAKASPRGMPKTTCAISSRS